MGLLNLNQPYSECYGTKHWNLEAFFLLLPDIPAVPFGVESCHVLAALDVAHVERGQ